jgi:hypothetical protein
MPLNQSFAISATVKAPAEDVIWFIKYHLNHGASKIFLWLDNPQDPLIHRINHPQVLVTACNEEHWKRLGLADCSLVRNRRSANAVEALRLAREEEISWLVVIDYDEILRADVPLPELFDSISLEVEVLRFPVWEGSVTQADNHSPFEQIKWFKPFPLPLTLARNGSPIVYWDWIWFTLRLGFAKFLGVRSATRHRFIAGHRSGKSAFRTHLNITNIGSHGPVPLPGKPFRLLRLGKASVLHYDACDFTSWRNKWEGRLSGNLQWVGSGHRHAYMQRYINARDIGEEALRDLFMQTKGVSLRELKILKLVGLIRFFRPKVTQEIRPHSIQPQHD